MKKYVVISLLLVYNFVAAQECAEKIVGPYVSLSGGGLFEYHNHDDSKDRLFGRDLLHSKTNPGYYAGGAIGYKFCNSIRLEGEFSYQTYNLKSVRSSYNRRNGDVKIFTYMANTYYDFDFLNFFLKPYFGMGIGYADAKLRTASRFTIPFGFGDEIHRKSFIIIDGVAWQAIAGVKYSICENLDLGFEYRYFQENEIKNNKVGLVLSRIF